MNCCLLLGLLLGTASGALCSLLLMQFGGWLRTTQEWRLHRKDPLR